MQIKCKIDVPVNVSEKTEMHPIDNPFLESLGVNLTEWRREIIGA